MKLIRLCIYKYKYHQDNKKMHAMLQSAQSPMSSLHTDNHHYRSILLLGSCFIFLLASGQILGNHVTHHLRAQQRVEVLSQIHSLKDKHPFVEADVPKTKRRHNFINEFDQLDAEQPKKYQILPSILIAQAADESNWGNSPLYQEADNAFGVKGSYHGHFVTMPTNEVVATKGKHGKKKNHTVSIHAKFKKYPSLRACVKDHNRMLKKEYLTSDVDKDSYISIAHALQHGGYATDPNYADNLITYVEANNLDRFD